MRSNAYRAFTMQGRRFASCLPTGSRAPVSILNLLARRTPLWLFILAEAESTQSSQRLGELGSHVHRRIPARLVALRPGLGPLCR